MTTCIFVMKYEFGFNHYFFPFFQGYVVSEIVFVWLFKTAVTQKIGVVFDENHFAFTVFFCAGECLFNQNSIPFINVH